MAFSIFTNIVSLASRRVAGWLLVVSLGFTGFGILIITYPKFFATLAAVAFFLAGAAFLGTAAKIYLAGRRLKKAFDKDSDAYRENVRLHIEEHPGAGNYDDTEFRM
jgi:hypothetical protein